MSRLRNPMLWAALVASLIAVAPLAQAESVSISNSGFELPDVPEASFAAYSPYDVGHAIYPAPGSGTGWDYRGGYRDLVDSRSTVHTPYEGSQFMDLYYTDTQVNINPNLAIGRFTQTLSANFAANTKYTLSAQVARNVSYNYAGYEIGMGDSDAYFAGISDNNHSLGISWDAVKTTGISPAVNGNWTQITLEYTTPASGGPIGNPIVIIFAGGLLGNQADVTDSYVTLFDTITLNTSTVPEPCAVTLLATGLIGLLAYAWRKRR